MMNWSNRASIINHFFFNCALFGAERTELLTNLLALGITNVNLSLLLIGCDDYDEVNKNIFKFVHHFIDSAGRLQCFITKVVMVYILYICYLVSHFLVYVCVC